MAAAGAERSGTVIGRETAGPVNTGDRSAVKSAKPLTLMKLFPIAILAAAALASTAARADHVSFRGFIRFGGPTYCAPVPGYWAPRPVYVAPPVYCPPVIDTPVAIAPPAGYWQVQTINVWVPSRWVTSYDAYGCARSYVVPGHYETRTQRVWVNASCG